MDPLPEKSKVKRIIWKRSKDEFGNIISNEDNSLASRYDDRNGSQPCDASMNRRNGLQDKQFSYPIYLSLCPKHLNTDRFHTVCARPLVNTQQVSPNANIILSGTASRRNTGPPVGAVDIGVSKCAYYFRVALPGVRKDPGDFFCEVEHDGKVHIHGVTTTGEKMVSRYSRVYNMMLQQQCPSGPFTLSFCLPGPVDPSLFSPNFRSDGIFEGVVVKDTYSQLGRRRD